MKSSATPLDLGIREFSSYDKIIDARSPREFAQDHIPNAINYPVVNDEEFAQVGTMHRNDAHAAYVIGVTHSLRNMANWIEQIDRHCSRSSRILVYCFRGGKRSKLWSDTLRTIGYRVDVLAGGWKNYRRWVISALEVVPRELNLKVISGPTGSGKSRLLQAIERQGGQVLDLEGLASHRGSLLGALPGTPQPTQKSFDSQLLDKMRHFNINLPVFVESESKKIGSIQLPEALMGAMRHADVIRIDVPLPERVKVWEEDFGHFVQSPQLLLSRVQHLLPLIGRETLQRWGELADTGRVTKVFEELMILHYDPAYERSNARLFKGQRDSPVLQIPSVNPAAMDEVATRLLHEHGAIA